MGKNAFGVIGIEMMVAAQGLDLRRKQSGSAFGDGTEVALATVRKSVAFLDIDCPLYNDHNAISDLIRDAPVLRAVEEKVGSLGAWASISYSAPEADDAHYGWFGDLEPAGIKHTGSAEELELAAKRQRIMT